MSWAHDASRMVQIADGRYPFHVSNCLTQAVTVWWLLRCGGIESDLRIGVRKEAGQLKAHAWVECEGYVLNDADETHTLFSPFPRAVISGKVHAS